MTYLNTHARTASATKNDLFQLPGRAPTLFGVFVGYVKAVDDVQRNGRLRVWIPELGSAPDNDKGWIIVNYCSPFAGATNVGTISTSNTQAFEGTQTSYGMWMVPPDINNEVLVMFINGDPGKGIWIGSLYNQYMNNMVPTPPASTNNYQYPGKAVPVAEYNKWDPKVNIPDSATKPFEATKFKGVGNQGLINDPIRGTTTTSARREAPSKVFGISTPGPAIDPSVPYQDIRRKGGSSFIMDDGDNSEYVQLATKTGAQIKIDETNGFIYMINRDGTAWVQMDRDGNIDIFGAKNISMRAQQDVNIRADRNVNIEAGQNIFMKAAKDTKKSTIDFTYDVNNKPNKTTVPYYKYVGEGEGEGGNIVMQALNNWHSTTHNNAFLTVEENNLVVDVHGSIVTTTRTGGQEYYSNMGIKLSTDAAFDVVAQGNTRMFTAGSFSSVSESDTTFCTSAGIGLKAVDDIQVASAADILLTSINLGVSADATFSATVGIASDLTVQGEGNVNVVYAQYTSGLGGPGSFEVAPPAEANPPPAQAAVIASKAKPAEVKPMNNKINILATWADGTPVGNWTVFSNTVRYKTNDVVKYTDQNKIEAFYTSLKDQGPSDFVPENWGPVATISDTKFKRNAEPFETTVSRLPTFEPCPEHASFNITSVGNYTPPQAPGGNTYAGSGGGGATSSPPPIDSPGANNKDLSADATANASIKDFNMPAYQCQLMIHEGVKYVSYKDSVGLPTGGIGHLLRTNEIPQYPVPTNISTSQVETWFGQDAPISITGAQRLLGTDVWAGLSDIRKRACADLCYNMGEGGLSKFKQFLAAMKASDFDKAGQQLKDSKWYAQVGRRGPNIITMIVQNVDPNGCDKKFPPKA